jgi:hypothetical protein
LRNKTSSSSYCLRFSTRSRSISAPRHSSRATSWDAPVDLEDEGYEIIPEARDYLKRYPLTDELLAATEEIEFDGGGTAYRFAWHVWDGEDDVFGVKDLSGIELCRNLRSFSAISMIGNVDMRTLLSFQRLMCPSWARHGRRSCCHPERHDSCTVTNVFAARSSSVMNWHKFGSFAPLMLVMNGSEKYRLVKSLGDAAEALFASWPLDDGEEYLVAVKTCLEALHGTTSPAEARSALIRAAEEAGIPVITIVH